MQAVASEENYQSGYKPHIFCLFIDYFFNDYNFPISRTLSFWALYYRYG